VRRLPSNALARPRPVEEPLHILRASRRRGLSLAPFEIDPDAEAREERRGGSAGAGGGGGSGVASGKPAAALLCAGPGGGAQALDF
jgi:hypothetical protein